MITDGHGHADLVTPQSRVHTLHNHHQVNVLRVLRHVPMAAGSTNVCKWNAILYCAGFSPTADAGLRFGRVDNVTNVKMTAALASLL